MCMCMHVCVYIYTHTHTYIFHLHDNREADLKEEDVVLLSSSFLRGSIFIKNPLQFDNQTVS